VTARRRLTGALAALALLGGGCSAGDGGDPGAQDASPATPSASSPAPSASTSGSGDANGDATGDAPATPAVPEDRACYDLGYDAVLEPTSEAAPVDCSATHTSRTYAVGDLDLVVDGHLLAVDSVAAQAQPAERCPGRLADFLGGTPDDLRLSVLRPVWYAPTVEQSDAGADWFRCDVIALVRDEELGPLTGRLEGVLGRPDEAERWRVCGTAEPGADDFERVACSEQHSWRALSVVDLDEGADEGAYPGEDVVSSAGDGTCEDAARDAAADPLNFRWGYEWPSAEQWEAGQRYGLCWAPA